VNKPNSLFCEINRPVNYWSVELWSWRWQLCWLCDDLPTITTHYIVSGSSHTHTHTLF